MFFEIFVSNYNYLLKKNGQKIPRMGEHWGCCKSYKNAWGGNTFQTTQFMDRESFRNQQKIITLLGNPFYYS